MNVVVQSLSVFFCYDVIAVVGRLYVLRRYVTWHFAGCMVQSMMAASTAGLVARRLHSVCPQQLRGEERGSCCLVISLNKSVCVLLTSAITAASMNCTKPCLGAVASTLYGVNLRSRFSRSNRRSNSVMS